MSLPFRWGACVAKTQTLGDGGYTKIFERASSLGCSWLPHLISRMHSALWITFRLEAFFGLCFATLQSPGVSPKERLPSLRHVVNSVHLPVRPAERLASPCLWWLTEVETESQRPYYHFSMWRTQIQDWDTHSGFVTSLWPVLCFSSFIFSFLRIFLPPQD